MLHLTTHKKGLKMDGFLSLNTSVFENSFCMKMCKSKKNICHNCYARSIEMTYTNLGKHLKENTRELITPLSDESLNDIVLKIKTSNRKYIRLHSFGELVNIEHLKNFYNIVEQCENQTFGLWTKRKDLVMKMYPDDKPENLSLIYSNPIIDKSLRWIPEQFNGTFTVLSYKYCKEHNVIPNCTGKCMTCLRCYNPEKLVVINELIKSDQTNVKKGKLEPLE